jgi:hypothetical protein
MSSEAHYLQPDFDDEIPEDDHAEPLDAQVEHLIPSEDEDGS